MNTKQLAALIKSLIGKAETGSEDSNNAGDDSQYAELAELVTAIFAQQTNPQTQPQVNSSNQDVIQLVTLLNQMQSQSRETPKPAYEEGFYADGKFDFSKINDEALKEAITDYVNAQVVKDNQRLIDDAVSTELKSRSLALKEDMFMKLLDTSAVKVVDGKVTGVKEAFDALNGSGVYKQAASTPLTQGFKPVENKQGSSTGAYASFNDAFEAQMEMTNN